MLVKEIMVKKVISVKKTDSVLKSFSLMMEKGIRHLPVLESKKIIGIITDRDIRQSLSPSKGPDFYQEMLLATNKKLVAEVMTEKICYGTPEMCVEEAASIMNTHKIGCLPLAGKTGNLIGIITKSDIIEIFITLMEMLQKSSRIDVLIEKGQKGVKDVEKIIISAGGEIISIGLSPAKKQNNQIYFFRIKKCDTKSIVSEIKKAGYKVVSVI